MQVRELVTRLGFNADTSSARSYETALRNVRRAALAVTAAVTATATATVALTNRMAAEGDQLAKTSDRLGVSTKQLQEWRFAADRSGVSSATLDMALQRMGRRVGEAAKGTGEAKKAIAEMGVSVLDAAGNVRTIESLLPEFADKLGAIENANERNALAMKLFDSEGVALVQMLQDGSAGLEAYRKEFERLGGGISDEGIAAAVEYTDRMTDMRLAISALRYEIGGRLMPAMTRIISVTTDWLAANRKWIAANLSAAVESARLALTALWLVLLAVTTPINKAIQATIGWERALRLLVLVATAATGMQLARWTWAIVAGVMAAARAVGLLRFAMMALMRVGILALLTALAIAIEDIYVWIKGGDSVLGAWLGTWEDFRAKATTAIQEVMAYMEPFIRQMKGAANLLAGVFMFDKNRILSGLQDLGTGMIDWARRLAGSIRDALAPALPDWMGKVVRGVVTMPGRAADALSSLGGNNDIAGEAQRSSSSRSVTVNARTEATLQVPQGTSAEQRLAIEAQAEQIFSNHWDREMRRALSNFQPVE